MSETAPTTQHNKRKDFDFQQHPAITLNLARHFNMFCGIRGSFNQGFTYVSCVQDDRYF